ncbi:MAG: hypothetical protein PHE73_03465 [Sulfurovaceae bacterium]|nr:hypothetical protein [Sulfurovaceae bacterium]
MSISKSEFIRFLKDNQLFQEYEKESKYEISFIWQMVKRKSTLLEDGVVIFHKNNPKWAELNRSWIKKCKEK